MSFAWKTFFTVFVGKSFFYSFPGSKWKIQDWCCTIFLNNNLIGFVQ